MYTIRTGKQKLIKTLKVTLIVAVLQALDKLHATKKCAYFMFIKHSLLNRCYTTDSSMKNRNQK